MQCELVECVEAFKSESGLQSINRRRKPTSAQKLSVLVDDPIRPTATEIDGDVMDIRCVKDAKVFRTNRWERAWSTAMSKLDTKTKLLEGDHGKKATIPLL